MVRDDILIGSLRIPVWGLQELVNYLESRRDLSSEDAVFCQQRVKETVKQLRALERLVDGELSRFPVASELCWN